VVLGRPQVLGRRGLGRETTTPRNSVDGGPVRPAALGEWGAEQKPQSAMEIARPAANWLGGPFPKADREFGSPAEAEPGSGGDASCERGLGPHAHRVGGTVRGSY
jgi:hypothetical protein